MIRIYTYTCPVCQNVQHIPEPNCLKCGTRNSALPIYCHQCQKQSRTDGEFACPICGSENIKIRRTSHNPHAFNNKEVARIVRIIENKKPPQKKRRA